MWARIIGGVLAVVIVIVVNYVITKRNLKVSDLQVLKILEVGYWIAGIVCIGGGIYLMLLGKAKETYGCIYIGWPILFFGVVCIMSVRTNRILIELRQAISQLQTKIGQATKE